MKIPGESYDISKTSSLLATSNIVGLIFVGTSDGFLGIKISDILKLDNETSSKKVEIVNYPHKKINLPSRACFLALSPDSLTLLVCIQKAGCPVGLLYDVRGYARDVSSYYLAVLFWQLVNVSFYRMEIGPRFKKSDCQLLKASQSMIVPGIQPCQSY